ncbi:MAG: SH3 domain-containing protein [Sphingomonas sp.]
MELDPRTNAVRADLADVRLADRVFAPHYASPMAMIALADTPILADRRTTAEALDTLAAGDVFDVLEVTASYSWGQRRRDRLVGYVANGDLRPGADGEQP